VGNRTARALPTKIVVSIYFRFNLNLDVGWTIEQVTPTSCYLFRELVARNRLSLLDPVFGKSPAEKVPAADFSPYRHIAKTAENIVEC
jgi:hypothetical protein